MIRSLPVATMLMPKRGIVYRNDSDHVDSGLSKAKAKGGSRKEKASFPRIASL